MIQEYLRRIDDYNDKLTLDDMGDGKMIIPASLTVFGCTDLHTEQVLNYFKTFAPDKVAWVDDDRVKLIWHEKTAAVRCFFATTHGYRNLKLLLAKARKRITDRGEKPQEDIVDIEFEGKIWRIDSNK